MKPFTYMLVAALAHLPLQCAQAGCHQLFHHRQVHHTPQVFYFAGQATQDESIVRKVVREELRQALQSPQQQQAASGVFAAKCAKCHTGDRALTGDPATFKAFARMAGIGEGIPNEMRGVISSLTPAEKGEITEYLLRLPEAGMLR